MPDCNQTNIIEGLDKQYFENRCQGGGMIQAGVLQEYRFWDSPNGYGTKPGDEEFKIHDNFDPNINDGQGLFPSYGYITLPGSDPECNSGAQTEYLQIERTAPNPEIGFTTVYFHKLSGLNCDRENYGGVEFYHSTSEPVIIGNPNNPYYACDQCQDTNLLRQEIRYFVNNIEELADINEPINGERALVKFSYSISLLPNSYGVKMFVYDCDYESPFSEIKHWKPVISNPVFDSFAKLQIDVQYPFEGDRFTVIENASCAYDVIYHNGNFIRVRC